MKRTFESRPAHPVLSRLVLGIDLTAAALKKRDDAQAIEPLTQILANAEYWLSFDVASFEPLLSKCPSPLRELGVAVALRYGEGIDGKLLIDDIETVRAILLPKLSPDLQEAIASGLATLERGVRVRDNVPDWATKGLKPYSAGTSLSVHALRAMGRSVIQISGSRDDEKIAEVRLGERLVVSASDERGRPLKAPEIESHLDSPLLAEDPNGSGKRGIVFLVPGEYQVRVPGRATGDRKLIAL